MAAGRRCRKEMTGGGRGLERWGGGGCGRREPAAGDGEGMAAGRRCKKEAAGGSHGLGWWGGGVGEATEEEIRRKEKEGKKIKGKGKKKKIKWKRKGIIDILLFYVF